MRRILCGLAASVVGLALCGTARADWHHGGPIHRGGSVAYYQQHGVRFSGGYYFPGREHHHWAYRIWDAHYHRYHYYDPTLRVYYYWYPAGNVYYPVGYCP